VAAVVSGQPVCPAGEALLVGVPVTGLGDQRAADRRDTSFGVGVVGVPRGVVDIADVREQRPVQDPVPGALAAGAEPDDSGAPVSRRPVRGWRRYSGAAAIPGGKFPICRASLTAWSVRCFAVSRLPAAWTRACLTSSASAISGPG